MYKIGDVVKLITISRNMSDLTLNAYYEVVEDEIPNNGVALLDDVMETNYVSPKCLVFVSGKYNSEVFELCEDKKFSINVSISKAGDDDSFLRFDHLSMTKQQMINTINQMWESV